VRLLLDTHAFVWWLAGDKQLSYRAQQAVEEADVVYVSAASAWEICTKHRIGKLPSVAGVVGRLSAVLDEHGFEPLAVTLRHGERAGQLAGPHKDPFDRMLVAQALLEELTLLSRDDQLDAYGMQRLW
jgi:PIN domain nuclease of toxin-antitoxin system